MKRQDIDVSTFKRMLRVRNLPSAKVHYKGINAVITLPNTKPVKKFLNLFDFSYTVKREEIEITSLNCLSTFSIPKGTAIRVPENRLGIDPGIYTVKGIKDDMLIVEERELTYMQSVCLKNLLYHCTKGLKVVQAVKKLENLMEYV